MRSITSILEDFRKPVPPSKLSQKNSYSKGKLSGKITYIHWYDLIDTLNDFAPGWGWEVRTHFLPDRCVIEGRLTIRATEGDYPMEATGVEMLDSNGFGDPVYSAEASALRRAMAKFGYALELWRKDKPAYSSKPNKPIETVKDFSSAKITEKQIARLHAIAKKEAGLNNTDIKRIIEEFANYGSTKNIIQSHYDSIVERIKQARFLTDIERKELMNWWRSQKISDETAKKAIFGMGYEGTQQITRIQINAVKSAILKYHLCAQ